jgi:hypothetical protein
MELQDAADLIEQRALSVSGQKLNGKNFDCFDNALLRIQDSDINEHIDCQASGQLYYGMLVRKAIENLHAVKLSYENWFSTKYDKCNEILKAETGIKRPNKVDVENRVRHDYPVKYKKFNEAITKAEFVYERLNLWYSAWLTKGFSLSDLKDTKSSRKIGGRDTRSLISKKGNVDVEEEE